jgi:hypothetical protein
MLVLFAAKFIVVRAGMYLSLQYYQCVDECLMSGRLPLLVLLLRLPHAPVPLLYLFGLFIHRMSGAWLASCSVFDSSLSADHL